MGGNVAENAGGLRGLKYGVTKDYVMSEEKRLVELFTEKARLTSAIVSQVKTLDEALAYTVDVCEKKEACQILMENGA